MISLREYKQSDIDRLVELANNAAVVEFLTDAFPHPYSREDAVWWINTGSKNGISRIVELDGEFVGAVGAEAGVGEKRKQFQIGYWLGEPYWGRGIATEALRVFAEYLFANYDVARLEAWVYSSNPASMRVLQKANFIEEAVLKKALYKNGEFYNEHVFSRLRS